jgi:hypothetical protein
MNKRIKELIEQAGFKTEAWLNLDGTPKATIYKEAIGGNNLEKFAELIVRECVQTLRDNTPVLDENESVEDWNKGYIRAMLDCEHHITEHFGVEE